MAHVFLPQTSCPGKLIPPETSGWQKLWQRLREVYPSLETLSAVGWREAKDEEPEERGEHAEP